MAIVMTPSVAYLLPVLLCFSTLIFASFAPRALLILRLVRLRLCGQEDPFDDDGSCDEDKVSREAANILTWTGVVMAVLSMLVAGFMGNLANSQGRRAPPTVVCFGEFLFCLQTAMVSFYKMNPQWLIAGAAVEGITGTYTCLLMATSSYVSDLNTADSAGKEAKCGASTSVDERAEKQPMTEAQKSERYSLVEAALTIGILVGPVGGGVAVAKLGYTGFYLLVSALLLVLIAYIRCILPETLGLIALKSDGASDNGNVSREGQGEEDEGDEEGAATCDGGAERARRGNLENDQASRKNGGSIATASGDTMLSVLRLAFATRPLKSEETCLRRRRKVSNAPAFGGARKDDKEDRILSDSTKAPLIDNGDDVEAEGLSSECGGDGDGSTSGPSATLPRAGIRLSRVSTAFMLLFGSNNAMTTIFILYTARIWDWNSVQIGVFISLIGGMGTFALLFSHRLFRCSFALVKRLRASCSKFYEGGGRGQGNSGDGEGELGNLAFMKAGAVASVAFNFGLALTSSPLAAYCLVPLLGVQVGAIPSYRALYAAAYGPADRSRIFAAVSILEAMPSLIAPLVYTQVYAQTVRVYPGAVFLCIGAASSAALALLLWSTTTIAPRSNHAGPASQSAPAALRTSSIAGCEDDEREPNLLEPPRIAPDGRVGGEAEGTVVAVC